jgi:alpha-L-arabinofuranosidase
VTVTLTNPSLDVAVTARIRGGPVAEAKGVVLTHGDMRGMNTFSNPNEVKPAPIAVKISGDAAEVSLPPKSVAALDLLMRS